MALTHVLNHDAMPTKYRRPPKVHCLHRPDCAQLVPEAVVRPATAEELRALPECKTCLSKELRETGA